MEYRYKPNGVCSSEMIFEIDENEIIQNLKVIGGCNGNLKGLGELIKEMKIKDVIKKLSDITCGYKNTSCPDQIARALIEYKGNKI